MHAFHVPVWVYVALVVSLVILALSITVIVLNARGRGGIRLTAWGYFAWTSLVFLSAPASLLAGAVILSFGGLR